MVSANHDALAASQQHVLELEHNMTVMIEQQVSSTRVGSSVLARSSSTLPRLSSSTDCCLPLTA